MTTYLSNEGASIRYCFVKRGVLEKRKKGGGGFRAADSLVELRVCRWCCFVWVFKMEALKAAVKFVEERNVWGN